MSFTVTGTMTTTYSKEFDTIEEVAEFFGVPAADMEVCWTNPHMGLSEYTFVDDSARWEETPYVDELFPADHYDSMEHEWDIYLRHPNTTTEN